MCSRGARIVGHGPAYDVYKCQLKVKLQFKYIFRIVVPMEVNDNTLKKSAILFPKRCSRIYAFRNSHRRLNLTIMVIKPAHKN